MEPSLLDTDMLNEVLKRRNPQVIDRAMIYLARHSQYFISALTRYELLRGLKECGAVKQQEAFEEFCRQSFVAPITISVLDRAADLWVLGRQGGHPCSDADLIIAATAIELQRTLVTGNTRHFAWVPSLRISDWRQP